MIKPEAASVVNITTTRESVMEHYTLGQRVRVRTAFGTFVNKVAVSDVIEGESFTVVRVCSEEEWTSAAEDGRRPHGTPWPVEDVHPLDAVPV